MPDCCSVFGPGTKARCVCDTLRRLGSSTVQDLARACGAHKPYVRHIIQRLEQIGCAKRVYYNDVAYTVVWSQYYSFVKQPLKR